MLTHAARRRSTEQVFSNSVLAGLLDISGNGSVSPAQRDPHPPLNARDAGPAMFACAYEWLNFLYYI